MSLNKIKSMGWVAFFVNCLLLCCCRSNGIMISYQIDAQLCSEYYGLMSKIDEIKARIDWLKDLFKIVITIMVADIAGVAKLYIDSEIGILFYMGAVLLPMFSIACVTISRKVENHLNELGEL